MDNGYVALAQSALGNLTLAQAQADSGGAYGVVALNLFDSNGNLAQDQLAVASEFAVPEPATAGCFLLGLGALACLRRHAQNQALLQRNLQKATVRVSISSCRNLVRNQDSKTVSANN